MEAQRKEEGDPEMSNSVYLFYLKNLYLKKECEMEEKKDSPEFPGAYEIRKESNYPYCGKTIPNQFDITTAIKELVEAHLEKLLNNKELEIQDEVERIQVQLEEMQAQIEELKEKPFWM